APGDAPHIALDELHVDAPRPGPAAGPAQHALRQVEAGDLESPGSQLDGVTSGPAGNVKDALARPEVEPGHDTRDLPARRQRLDLRVGLVIERVEEFRVPFRVRRQGTAPPERCRITPRPNAQVTF